MMEEQKKLDLQKLTEGEVAGLQKLADIRKAARELSQNLDKILDGLDEEYATSLKKWWDEVITSRALSRDLTWEADLKAQELFHTGPRETIIPREPFDLEKALQDLLGGTANVKVISDPASIEAYLGKKDLP